MPSNQEPDLATDEAIDGLLGLIDQGFTNAVRDIWDFGTDLPGLVARDGPESPPIAAVKPIIRAACRSYARGDGPQNLPGFDGAWGLICEPYLDGIGENPGDGSLAPDYLGGQCPAIYTATWEQRRFVPGSGYQWVPQGPSQTLQGPVSVRAGDDNGSLPCGQGENYAQWIISGVNNQNPTSLVAGCIDGGKGFRNLVLTRVDGQADDCGNVPPTYTPPRVPPGLPPLSPFPIRIPGVGPVNVDVKFNPDGTINVGLPDLGVEVNVDDPFGLGGDGDGPGGGPPPGDVGEPGSPVGVGSDGAEEGVAPEGSVLVGLRVQVVTVPNSRNRYTDEVLRGAYYVYMGVPGLLDHDPAGAMVRTDQFIFAEQPNLTAWRIRANTGYELITTPYYRRVEE